MKFTRVEYHQVASYFTYEFDEAEIEDVFGSVQRFREITSHSGIDTIPEGEPPTDDESDAFYEFISDCDYDREDDWWTDRKGGYDIDYRIDE